MDGTASRLLQLLVAATLTGVAMEGRADTTTLDPVRAVIPDGWDGVVTGNDGGDFEPTFDHDEDWGDDNPEYSGSDGDDTDQMTEERKAECAAIAAKVGQGCNLSTPPALITNGCGSEGSELVPDYLIVNFVPMLQLGPIFTPACDRHDECYGTYPADKNACDAILYNDMVEYAQNQLSSMQWTAFRFSVMLQAMLYSQALQSPFLAGASGEAFASAQSQGACRYYAAKAKAAGCPL